MIKVILTIPVYNEEEVLEENIKKITNFLRKNFRYSYTIIIADNASTDRTGEIGENLSKQFQEVDYFFIPQKGRGFALREAWTKYKADVYSYMDVDLSTNLKAFPQIINLVIKGNDVVIGTRLLKESKVIRKLKRKILSRGYNLILKIAFNNKFSDAQCGFKAVSKKIVEEIVPKVRDNKWFFDTELLIRAENKGYKIKEIPVNWTGDRNSKVKIFSTIYNFLRNIFRLKRELLVCSIFE